MPVDDPAVTREIPIGVELVRRLVNTQLAPVDPVAAAGELVELSSGWDNVMFRLGETLTVRLPHRALAVPLIRNEALVALHRPAPADAPANRSSVVRQRILDWDGPWATLLAAWDAGLAAAVHRTAAVAARRSAPAEPGASWRRAVRGARLRRHHRRRPGQRPGYGVVDLRAVGPAAVRRASRRRRVLRPGRMDPRGRLGGRPGQRDGSPGTRLYPLALHTAAQLG